MTVSRKTKPTRLQLLPLKISGEKIEIFDNSSLEIISRKVSRYRSTAALRPEQKKRKDATQVASCSVAARDCPCPLSCSSLRRSSAAIKAAGRDRLCNGDPPVNSPQTLLPLHVRQDQTCSPGNEILPRTDEERYSELQAYCHEEAVSNIPFGSSSPATEKLVCWFDSKKGLEHTPATPRSAQQRPETRYEKEGCNLRPTLACEVQSSAEHAAPAQAGQRENSRLPGLNPEEQSRDEPNDRVPGSLKHSQRGKLVPRGISSPSQEYPSAPPQPGSSEVGREGCTSEKTAARASLTGAAARVVAHLKSNSRDSVSTASAEGPAVVHEGTPAHAAPQPATADRAARPGGFPEAGGSHFNPLQEARKAAARLQERRKKEQEEAELAELEEAERRRAIHERRLQANEERRARRMRVYALNAIGTLSERAKEQIAPFASGAFSRPLLAEADNDRGANVV